MNNIREKYNIKLQVNSDNNNIYIYPKNKSMQDGIGIITTDFTNESDIVLEFINRAIKNKLNLDYTCRADYNKPPVGYVNEEFKDEVFGKYINSDLYVIELIENKNNKIFRIRDIDYSNNWEEYVDAKKFKEIIEFYLKESKKIKKDPVGYKVEMIKNGADLKTSENFKHKDLLSPDDILIVQTQKEADELLKKAGVEK